MVRRGSDECWKGGGNRVGEWYEEIIRELRKWVGGVSKEKKEGWVK